MVELHNHTPHPIDIRTAGHEPIVLEPQLPLPRVSVTRRDGGTLDTRWGPVPLTVTESGGEVIDLPGLRPGVCLLVARGVADAARDRADLLFPDDLVRDDRGIVVACRALGRVCLSGR